MVETAQTHSCSSRILVTW